MKKSKLPIKFKAWFCYYTYLSRDTCREDTDVTERSEQRQEHRDSIFIFYKFYLMVLVI